MWSYDLAASQALTDSGVRSFNHRVDAPAPVLPPDIQDSLQSLVQLIKSDHEQVAPYWSVAHPLLAGRAPGRLDVMGGVSDYSGSTVLQMPLEESTIAFCQYQVEPVFRVISMTGDSENALQDFHMPMEDFFKQGSKQLRNKSQMRAYLADLGVQHQWAAYIVGVLTVLMQHTEIVLHEIVSRGIVVFIKSTVPVGKGVSSSAALEVATMRALCGLLKLKVSAHQQAVLCQEVENEVVGAPCGLMDQMASSCGEQGALLNMLCQPDIVNKSVTLPDGLSVWAIDSGIRHAVTGADYSSVRIAAFMGYRYLLEAAGIAPRHQLANTIDDTRWNGYLANVSVAEFLQHYAQALPQRITGRDFLNRFDDTTDTITTVDPETTYAVRACAAHPIHENFRVRLFAQLANTAAHMQDAEPVASLMGECMYQSHASYSTCGLDSKGTDELVARLSAKGLSEWIYGARITGGGSGGAVAVLGRCDADSVVRSVAAEYAEAAGVGGHVFSGSSPGASVHVLIPLETV